MGTTLDRRMLEDTDAGERGKKAVTLFQVRDISAVYPSVVVISMKVEKPNDNFLTGGRSLLFDVKAKHTVCPGAPEADLSNRVLDRLE